MKFKGMWLDTNPTEQPVETTRINKNIVVTDKFGSITNEKGLTTLRQLNLTPIGHVVLNKNDFVVFSTDDVSSEIGLMTNDTYRVIMNDVGLKFNKGYPIHGEYFLNLNKERIVTWTDNNNVLRSINVDNPYNNVDKLNSFNYYKIPNVNISIEENGQLQAGVYQIVLEYVHQDGSVTNTIKKWNPVYIYDDNSVTKYEQKDGIESGLLTNKSIRLDLQNLDLNYNKLNVGFVYQSKGIRKYYFSKTYDIKTTSLICFITGTELFVQKELSEVIIDKANYKRIEHITPFENRLYGLNVSVNKEKEGLQDDVKNINVKWYSELHEIYNNQLIGVFPDLTVITTEKDNYKQHDFNYKKKTFQHDEVYALYVRFKWKWGWGHWYELENRNSNPSDLIPSDYGNFKYFHTNDTCNIESSNSIVANGQFSYWENESDGRKLFKFPSLNYVKNNIWTIPNYGSTAFDILSIGTDINLASFVDVDGSIPETYEIGYAKNNNNRIVSQSNFVPTVKNRDNLLVSNSGNWNTTLNINNVATLDYDTIRTYPVEMLRNNNKNIFNYIRVEWYLNNNFQKVSKVDQGNNYSIYYNTDSQSTNLNYNLILVDSSTLLPNNVITSFDNNSYLEETLKLTLVQQLLNQVPLTQAGVVVNIDSFGQGTFAEYNCLLTFVNVQTNYQINVNEIINCGESQFNGAVFGFYGDTFWNDTSITTYGVQYNDYTTDLKIYQDNPDQFNFFNNGYRVARRTLFQSKLNLNLRYINPKFEFETSYYPKSYAYLEKISKDVNPNDFINGYETDMNMINDIAYSDIYDKNKTYYYDNPFKIITSEAINRDLEIDYNAWRDFKLNNFYECVREKGLPKNLEAGNDYLYIHFENSLYRTKPRGVLESVEGLSIQLGYGNIFQFDPIAILHSELGELGTQHKWSCLFNKHGYIFYDSHKGSWFIVNNNNVNAISNKGLFTFFKDNKTCLFDNPFDNNGVFCSYDEEFNRLLVTKKNKRLKEVYRDNFKGEYDPKMTYQAGDIVILNNKYQIFE